MQGGAIARHNSFYPAGNESKSISDDEDADSVHSKDSDSLRSSRTRGRYKQRDMRRSKSEVRPSDLRQAEDEYLRRTSSREASPALALSLKPLGDSVKVMLM